MNYRHLYIFAWALLLVIACNAPKTQSTINVDRPSLREELTIAKFKASDLNIGMTRMEVIKTMGRTPDETGITTFGASTPGGAWQGLRWIITYPGNNGKCNLEIVFRKTSEISKEFPYLPKEWILNHYGWVDHY